MSEHFESALFVYSEAGKIYRDTLVENSHGSSISPVSIEELRDNTSVLLKDTNHVVIAAELLVIKEVMLLSRKYGFSLGFLPLKEQKALKRCYIIPEDEAEMISLALKNDPSKMDLVFCNDQILLFKGVIGRIPLIDSLKNASKLKILGEALKKVSSLNLLPFTISTFGNNKTKTKTAACGCMVLENPELSYASGMIGDDCSFEDSMISTMFVAPFSVIDYLKLLWQRIFSDPESNRISPSVGYIKTPELLVETETKLCVAIDGENLTTTPAHFRVDPDALRINHGFEKNSEKLKGRSSKEKFAIQSLPAGKEVEKARNKRIPFFTYASEERFKDLFTALRDDARLDSTYVVLMILSTTLATVGLYLNSASVIIGAMLLAPLMAPIISLAMSLLRYDKRLFKQSAIKVLVGIGVALITALMLAFISPYQPFTDEMQARLNPSLLDLVVAIVAGIAGAYTKSFKEILQSLAGVAIAVALVPPLSVAGIGLGRLDMSFFGQAFLLFTTNLIGIILAATITFRLLGYSPVVRDKRTFFVVVVSMVIISVPLSFTFRGITQRIEFEKSWTQERFLVNQKYLIVNDAQLTTDKKNKVLVVDIHAREVLNRDDLNVFKRKVQRNFPDDLIIRAKITYIP